MLLTQPGPANFGEPCISPVASPFEPPTVILDTSTVTYSDYIIPPVLGGPTITYTGAEGRLAPWLRAVAAGQDPLAALVQGAVSFYLIGQTTTSPRAPQDTAEVATALADLAVSGRGACSRFLSSPPQAADLLADVSELLSDWISQPVDQARLNASVNSALDRAYTVAWALRDSDTFTRAALRPALGWIAVSAEDDPPDNLTGR